MSSGDKGTIDGGAKAEAEKTSIAALTSGELPSIDTNLITVTTSKINVDVSQLIACTGLLTRGCESIHLCQGADCRQECNKGLKESGHNRLKAFSTPPPPRKIDER